jgi:SAM-dependent methyltransferase
LHVDEDKIIREISPADRMMGHREAPYLAIGRSALDCIGTALDASPKQTLTRILDLPCGHGRVMRMLRAAFPESELTACDISRDAVDFCVRTFEAIPVYSHEDPRSIELDGPFDLIFCGSLLTHIDAERWTGFLDLFESLLAPDAVLVFSTNGRRVASLLRRGTIDLMLGQEGHEGALDDFSRGGFGYRDYPDAERYGISLAHPAWVVEQVASRSSWRLATLHESGWSNFQDMVSCVKQPVDAQASE